MVFSTVLEKLPPLSTTGFCGGAGGGGAGAFARIGSAGGAPAPRSL